MFVYYGLWVYYKKEPHLHRQDSPRIYEIIMKKTIYVLQCSYILVYGFTAKMNPNLTAWIHEVTSEKIKNLYD